MLAYYEHSVWFIVCTVSYAFSIQFCLLPSFFLLLSYWACLTLFVPINGVLFLYNSLAVYYKKKTKTGLVNFFSPIASRELPYL